MGRDGSSLRVLITGRTAPLRGVAAYRNPTLDADARLYFCENRNLKSSSLDGNNSTIKTVDTVDVIDPGDRGACNGLAVDRDRSSLVVATTTGEICYLTNQNPRLVSNGSMNDEKPIYDANRLAIQELEGVPAVLSFVEYYPADTRMRMLFGPRLARLTVFNAQEGTSLRSVVTVEVKETPTPVPTPSNPGGYKVQGRVDVPPSSGSAPSIGVFLNGVGPKICAVQIEGPGS
jgi:hypothetical protein